MRDGDRPRQPAADVTGDPDRFGRVYVGTHGRGVLYGDPDGAGSQ